MKRRLPAMAGALAALALLLFPGTGSAATSGVEQIRSYDVTLTVGADGGLHVRETIAYDFGFQQRHGIIRVIPEVVRADDTYDRKYPIDDIEVRATGASAATSVSRSDGRVSIRVGDPDETVSGEHTYVIDYDVDGAVEHFAEPFDHAELNWDAVGDEWTVPVVRARVRVDGPVAVTSATCFSGPTGSTLSCERQSVQGSTATFVQSGMAPGQGLTVVTAYPSDAVEATGPILRERPTLRRAFALTPASLALTAAVLLLIAAGIARVYWARGRDRRFVGQVPGLEPAAGQPVVEEATPLVGGAPTVVEYAPPDGIRPGQCGTLLDERADILDVTATIVDLAVRGYLRIDELPREHWWSHKDWKLTRLKEPDDGLVDYESRLMKGLFFDSGAVVELSDLRNTFYKDLAAVQDKLYQGAVAAKWFRRRPDRVREVWTLIGIGVIAAGIGLTVLLFLYTHVALAGLAVILGGIVLLAMRGTMPARTAKGSAMLARVRGFRRYLDTAEAEQLRFEERADVFARYLPYAVVFGLTDRWSQVFAVLAAADPQLTSSVGWYGGQPGWNVGQLSGSLSHFMSSAGGTLASHPSSSGGGSGFSGGSSGGGGGGGGGGSW